VAFLNLTHGIETLDPSMPVWAVGTKRLGLEMCRAIVLEHDPAELREEYQRVTEEYPLFSGHRPGTAWQCLSLISAGGDAHEIRRLSKAYEKTEAVKFAPATERLIDSFRCEKRRVRYARLLPQHVIDWHYDAKEALDLGFARVHIPIVTNDQVVMQLSHEERHFGLGRAWYGDFSFPHRAWNGGSEAKVHLILELVVNDFVSAFVGPGFDDPRRAACRAAALSNYEHARSLVHSSKAVVPSRASSPTV